MTLFYDQDTLFEDQHLVGRDGIHLNNQGKDIFANRMSDLIRRALN